MSASESFCRSPFARFVNSPAGRLVRVVVGLCLFVLGYALRPGAGGIVLMLVGMILVAAGLFHLCLISALLGGPISGARINKMDS